MSEDPTSTLGAAIAAIAALLFLIRLAGQFLAGGLHQLRRRRR